MTHYYEKYYYLLRRQDGFCPIAKMEGWADSPTELHHRLHNTKVNRRKYPLLIDSVWNLVAVAHWAHIKHPSWGKMTYLEAAKRQAFLERHPCIAAAVNMEVWDARKS